MRYWIAIPIAICFGFIAITFRWNSRLDIVKSIELGEHPSVAISRDHLWFRKGRDLFVLDLTQPTLTPVQSHYQFGGRGQILAAEAETLLLSDEDAILVCDVRDPTHPKLISKFSPPGNFPSTAALRGNLLVLDGYLADTQVLHCYDLRDLELPELETTLTMTRGAGINDIALTDDSIFVANGYEGLTIIERVDGAGFQVRGKLAFAGHARGVWAADDRAYVAASMAPGLSSEFAVVDITDARSPVKIASIETPGGAQDVFVRGSLAFVADRERGILTIDLSAELRPVVIDRYQTGEGAVNEVAGSDDLMAFAAQTGIRNATLRLARFAPR